MSTNDLCINAVGNAENKSVPLVGLSNPYCRCGCVKNLPPSLFQMAAMREQRKRERVDQNTVTENKS